MKKPELTRSSLVKHEIIWHNLTYLT